MITRLRIEATGETRNIVVDQLLAVFETIKAQAGGEWENDARDMEIIQAREGYWGRLTIRRMRDGQTGTERVSAGSDTAGDGEDRGSGGDT